MKISIDIYNQRLLRLFKRLNRFPELREPIIREAWIITEDREYSVSFNMIYFFELPFIFNEWSYYEPAHEVEIMEWSKHLGMVGMLMQFFDLTPEEFIELFGFKEGVSSQEVAARIKRFVRNKILR
jgi:hypothetical protein